MGNDNVIYQGPQETVADPSDPITKNILAIKAETDITISALTYMFPANPASPQAISAFTLKAGGFLFHVASIAFTGTATITYYNSRQGSNGGN